MVPGSDLVLQLDLVCVVQPEDRVSVHHSQFTPPRALAPDHADGTVGRDRGHGNTSSQAARQRAADPIELALQVGHSFRLRGQLLIDVLEARDPSDRVLSAL